MHSNSDTLALCIHIYKHWYRVSSYFLHIFLFQLWFSFYMQLFCTFYKQSFAFLVSFNFILKWWLFVWIYRFGRGYKLMTLYKLLSVVIYLCAVMILIFSHSFSLSHSLRIINKIYLFLYIKLTIQKCLKYMRFFFLLDSWCQ